MCSDTDIDATNLFTKGYAVMWNGKAENFTLASHFCPEGDSCLIPANSIRPKAKRQILMSSLYRISEDQVCVAERIDSRVHLSAGNKGEITLCRECY